jgi:hypothetical protein
MISVTGHADTQKLLDFAPYAHIEMHNTVDDVIDFGDAFMGNAVPVSSAKLYLAIGSRVSSVVDPQIRGMVYVDQAIAPHAVFVDKGTGIDGPFHTPVTVTRPPFNPYKSTRSGNTRKVGAMQFQKQGEPIRHRKTVKATPSDRIARGKNFSGRTHVAMRAYTRANVGILSKKLALFFVRDRT